MTLDKKLLEILVCPRCKGNLDHRDKEDQLVCPACRLVYPIKNDIPVMLPAEATLF